MPADVAAIATGDPAGDAIVRAAFLLERRRPRTALAVLTAAPAESKGPASPDPAGLHAQRLALLARAHAQLGDVEAFLRCREEAEQLAASRQN